MGSKTPLLLQVFLLFPHAFVSASLPLNRAEPRVSGGSPASPGQFPFIASIQDYGYHNCGGVLIAPNVILTAAHCLTEANPSEAEVWIGGLDLAAPDSFQSYHVDSFLIHPFYEPDLVYAPSSTLYSANDIALVYLTENVPDAPIIALNEDLDLEVSGVASTVAGWGENPLNTSNTYLLYANLTMYNQRDCIADYFAGDEFGDNVNIGTGVVCATDLDGDKDACFGDSGGPLVVEDVDGTVKLVGLVSLGDTRCLDFNAGVYTGLSGYVCWLEGLGVPGVTSVRGPCDAVQVQPLNEPTPTSTPTATPTVEPRTDGDGDNDDTTRECFPAAAEVVKDNGEKVDMETLTLGDRVQVTGGRFETVHYFSHKSMTAESVFVQIQLESGEVLEATPGHLLLSAEGLLAAGKVVPGVTQLVVASGDFSVVSMVTQVHRRGLFNPHTASGTIVVNGVTASCYTRSVSVPIANMLLSVQRQVYEWTGRNIFGAILDEKLPSYLAPLQRLIASN